MNKAVLALAVPLVFAAAGCHKTEIDPTQPVAIVPHPVTVVTPAPQAANTAPATAPLPDNNSSATSSTPSQGNELNTQSQSPSAATDSQTSQSKN